MATRVNTVYYAFDTLQSLLATNTTLATSTRHNFAKSGSALTLHIPETGSRTFLSVRAIIRYRDAYTVATTDTTGWRIGVQLGAAAVNDADTTNGQTNTANSLYDCVDRDLTDYFNANFGVGASQTCTVGFAVSTSVAANIGSATCLLEVTYSYDDTVGTQRVKSVPIGIQSYFGTLTTAHLEVGTEVSGGANGAPANQIPALSTFLEESGVTIRGSWIDIEMRIQASGTADITPYVQIDATAEVAGPLWEGAIAATTIQHWIFQYDTAVHSTAATHAFKMRADANSRAAFGGACELWVTYTYDAATTTRVLNVIDVPMLDSAGENDGTLYNLNPTANVAGDAVKRIADFVIPEPGTITMKRAHARVYMMVRSSAPNIKISLGAQPFREWGPPNNTAWTPFIQRGDHNSGWSIARGRNVLTLDWYNVAISRITAYARARIVYSSDVPAQGVGACSRIVSFFHMQYNAVHASQQPLAVGGGQRTPALGGSPFYLHSVYLHARVRMAQSQILACNLFVGATAGELQGETYLPVTSQEIQLSSPSTELTTNEHWADLTHLFTRSSLTGPTKLNVETARRWYMAHGTTTFLWGFTMLLSMHQCTFNVAGTVTLAGAPVTAGNVEVYAVRSDGTSHRVGTAAVSGSGTFAVTVLDDYRDHFVVFNDGVNRGVSETGTPSVDTFDISMGSSGVALVPPTVTFVTTGNILRNTPIVARATDDIGLRRVFVYASYAGVAGGAPPAWEVVFDGENWSPNFSPVGSGGSNSRTVIAGGYEFSILRNGGWHRTPRIHIIPIDVSGNGPA